MVATRWSLRIALGLVAAALAGCQNSDEIRRYQVPRVEAPREKDPPRMLAAILPDQDKMWFFKVSGPDAVVGASKDAFEGFIQSVRFTGKADEPVAWTVPPGWRKQDKPAKPSNMPGLQRYATFLLGPMENPLELSVLPLDRKGEAASVLANVNRWRRQLGLGEVAAGELGKVTTELKVGDVVATLVDIRAAAAADGAGPPPLVKGGADSNLPLTFKAPEGWQQQPPGQFAVLAFQVVEDGKTAGVTVSRFGGTGGGLVKNVNRWRVQLKLDEASEEQLRKDMRTLQVAGIAAPYVDLVGPEEGGQRKEILGVIVERGGETWFFKMTGPAGLVTRQKPAFEAFVQSVQFDGGKGAER